MMKLLVHFLLPFLCGCAFTLGRNCLWLVCVNRYKRRKEVSTTLREHPGEAATCEYHADIASGFTSIKGDLRWFGAIGKWILGTTCSILAFMVIQALVVLGDTNKMSSKIDMLMMRADKVTEINRMQNEKLEVLMNKLIVHDEQIKILRNDIDNCFERRKQ